MKKVVVLSGAGMSAESGIQTFRGAGGLWEGHDVMKVASPEGFAQNPELVLEFYNQRRKRMRGVKPNDAHRFIAQLESHFDVQVITQNIDNLHEQAGSSKVVHLHGEIMKARSSVNESYVVELNGTTLNVGDLCPDGHQLRPHVVWFGEAVPMMDYAVPIVNDADYLIVIGTSLQVYPAASLMHYAKEAAIRIAVDPAIGEMHVPSDVITVEETAVNSILKLKDILNI